MEKADWIIHLDAALVDKSEQTKDMPVPVLSCTVGNIGGRDKQKLGLKHENLYQL